MSASTNSSRAISQGAVNKAYAEVIEEDFRREVEAYKQVIRARRKAWRWWHRFIPFTITIRRREPWL